jgi:hypothetical protein
LYSWNVLLLIRISLPLPCITPHWSAEPT